MFYLFEIDVAEQLDQIMKRSVNALLREYAVAGVELLCVLKNQNITIDADTDKFYFA